MRVQTLIAMEIVQDLAGSSTGADESAQPSLNLDSQSDSDSDSVSTQPPLQFEACAQFHLQERGRFPVFSVLFSFAFFFGAPGLINASMLVLRNHNDDDDRNQMIITGPGTRLRLRLGLRLGRLGGCWGSCEAC